LGALAASGDGLRQRDLEALIGFDQSRVLIDRRGERRLGYQFAAARRSSSQCSKPAALCAHLCGTSL
jgi:hypothetical protein